MSEHCGSCLCGAVKFRIEGDFDSFYLCHCTRCQKDSGSAHAANLFSQSASITWLSGEESVTHFKLEGTLHSKSFCKNCGSAVPGLQMGSKLLVVPAGCLDSQITMRPNAHIFISSKAGWDTELERLPVFGELPE